jgi:hypothetical protein
MRQWQSYAVADVRSAKILTHCIYCPGIPDGEEHWLPRSFGAFRGNSLLKGRICKECNVLFGHTLDQELIRTGHTGMTRQLLGISGRSGQPLTNVFEYKTAQLERPIEAESASIVPGQITPIQAVGQNPDGTLKSVQQRTLTIATPEGERILVFPRAWGAKQLHDAAAARDLLGGKVIRAHAAPPETASEFVANSLDVIRRSSGLGTSISIRPGTMHRSDRLNTGASGSTSAGNMFARSPRWRFTISSGHVRGSAATNPNWKVLNDSCTTGTGRNTTSSSAMTAWWIVAALSMILMLTATCLAPSPTTANCS